MVQIIDFMKILRAPATPGTAGQVLGLDENGNPIWVDAAEAGTYDGAMSDSSTNAPQNKVVKAYVDDTKAAIDSELGDYAKKVGEYPNLFAGNLTGEKVAVPDFASPSFDATKAGYALRATGFDPTKPENEYADGPAVLREIVGRAAGWNQLVQNGNFASTSGWTTSPAVTSFSVANNVATIVSGASGSVNIRRNIVCNNAHKYLVRFKAKVTDGTSNVTVRIFVDSNYTQLVNETLTGDWKSYSGINQLSVNGVGQLYFIMSNSATVQVKDIVCTDLTLLNATLTANLSSTAPTALSQVFSYMAGLRTSKPYWPYNACTLLGARMLGWAPLGTKNLLDPQTGKAKLFEYTYDQTVNEYTVIGWGNLTGAALQFTPHLTGIAEAVTLEGGKFSVSGAGELEVVDAVEGTDYTGDLGSVCVVATYDGSEDTGHANYSRDLQEIDSAKIYHKNGDNYVQEFDGGILRAAGYDNSSPRDRVFYDSVTQKWVAEHKVGVKNLATDFDYTVNEWNGAISFTPQDFSGASDYIFPYGYGEVVMAASDAFIASTRNINYANTDCLPMMSAVDEGFQFRYPGVTTEEAFKTAMTGKSLWYALRQPTTVTDLYYKTGDNEYVPMEQLWPDGIIAVTNNWSEESLLEEDVDNNGQPLSITPIVVEVFSEDLKEEIRTVLDTYISKEEYAARTQGSFSNLLTVVNEKLGETMGGSISVAAELDANGCVDFAFTESA